MATPDLQGALVFLKESLDYAMTVWAIGVYLHMDIAMCCATFELLHVGTCMLLPALPFVSSQMMLSL